MLRVIKCIANDVIKIYQIAVSLVLLNIGILEQNEKIANISIYVRNAGNYLWFGLIKI